MDPLGGAGGGFQRVAFKSNLARQGGKMSRPTSENKLSYMATCKPIGIHVLIIEILQFRIIFKEQKYGTMEGFLGGGGALHLSG